MYNLILGLDTRSMKHSFASGIDNVSQKAYVSGLNCVKYNFQELDVMDDIEHDVVAFRYSA